MKAAHHASTSARVLLVLLLSLLSACASVPPSGAAANPSAADPWQAWNRKVFAFNEAIDEALIKPVATTWRDVVPKPVRQGVSNFFGNLGDVWSAANQVLQGKLGTGLEMGMRVMSNTFIGLGGVLDPATEMGLAKRSEDLGQTLAVWGMGNGPYVVLPLLGPSTLRDSFVLPVDTYLGSPSRYIDGINNYVATPLRLVQLRSELLDTTTLIDQVSLDKYSFVRDGFLARRLDQIYDGAPPLPKFEDDVADEPSKPGVKPAAKPEAKK
jgi:phospholipid-binding lipoprotein MlaA